MSLDNSNLREVILEYPNQLSLGQKFAENITIDDSENIKNLVVCGMGGSALPADLLSAYLIQEDKKFDRPIYISRDYHLPKQTTEDSLIFISSYSGNTEETVSCFKEALEKKAKIVAFAAGGKVEEIARDNNTPLVKYQIDFPNFQPRYASTYAFAAMQKVLTNIGLSDSINEFPSIDPKQTEVLGEELANRLANKIPIIYASNKNKILAKNWKIKINENAKSPAFWNYFPELNHNEMVGFSLPKDQYLVFFLEDASDDPRIRQRMDLTAELYEKKGLETKKISIEGNDFLEKSINALLIGDWLSYYLALGYNQDPTPVDMVEELK